MKPWLEKLKRAKPEIIDRSNYLRLDKNERVIDFDKKFLNYLKKNLNTFHLSAYPNISKIKKLIARKNNIKEKNIFISAGSDLVLKTCFELFTKKNDKVIILEPTFGMVNVYCSLYNLNPIKIGYNNKLILDTEKLLKSISKKISLIVLANPNSPTGTIIKDKIIIKIVNKAKNLSIPVVIDEAYEGFFNKSYLKLIKNYKNVVITRTFSKSFGLAGLRAGYAAGNEKVIDYLSKYRPMYEINSISCLAIEFLIKNFSIVKKHINEVKISKNFLVKELKKINIKYINTHANFFHIETGKNNYELEKKFKNAGILFRKGPGVKGLENYSRFSLGSKKQMLKVLNLIKNINGKD